MQNSNPQYPNGDSKIPWGKFKEWLSQNPLAGILMIILLLVVIVYQYCNGPGTPAAGPLAVSFDPLGGAAVNDSKEGNNDGQLNPGEQAEVRVRLTNTSRDTMPAFTLALASSSQEVLLPDNRLSFPAINPRDTVLSRDTFTVQLSEDYSLPCVSLVGTVVSAAQAGFIAEAFAAEGETVTIDLFVFSNYRVSLGICTLVQGANSEEPDIFTINLALCNSSRTPLNNVRIAIADTSIHACDSPQPFTTVIEGGKPLDKLSLGTVGSSQCAHPFDATPTVPLQFKYAVQALVPPPPPQTADTTRCIYFSVRILTVQGTTEKLKAEFNMGVKARQGFRAIEEAAVKESMPRRADLALRP